MRKFYLFSFVLMMMFVLTGCHTDDPALWCVVEYNGQTMVEKTADMPVTDIHDAVITATGTEADAVFVDAVETATHKTEQQALDLLKSFDTKNGHKVQVMTIKGDTSVTRYWSEPTGKIGRWYTNSYSNKIHAPTDIVKILALPLTNTGKFTTLYNIKDGAVAVYGLCADMTGNPANFGPTATGGGEQLFVPDATTWNAQTQTSALNPAVITLIEEIRFAKP